jgi:predicted nucleotide-binding protein
MCKICEQMQISKYLIFNISGLNPNVMLELGLSYGLGKETIIIKDKKTKSISDLGSNEYIEYSHAGELQQKLTGYFSK